MIKKPYSAALPKAFPFSAPLVKKLTVRGSIGKMQGISKAAKPPTNPEMKILNKVVSCPVVGILFIFTALSAALTVVLTVSFEGESSSEGISVNSSSSIFTLSLC